MKKLYVLLAVLLLASCSKLSIGVYWADTFALSQIDDFFVLDSRQREEVKKGFRAAFTDVRKNDFPRIATVLEGIAGEVEKGALRPDRLAKWHNDALGILKDVVGKFEPLGQKLVAMQAPLGFEKFDEEFFDRFEDRKEKLASDEGFRREARKRVDRVIDETFGFLNDAQEKMLSDLLAQNPLRQQHEGRLHLFERFRAARGKSDTSRAFVTKYFRDWDSLQRPEYIRAREAYQAESRRVIMKMLEAASPEQKKNLVENFRKRAGELRELALSKD